MNKGIAQGVLLITIATFIARVLGSFYRIPLQNIAGNEVLGVVTLVYPIYMTALTLSVAGIPLTISKLIAEARTEQGENQIHYIYKAASILALIFGCISFVIMMLTSELISQMLGPQTYFPLIVVSVSLLFIPKVAVFRGFFQGFEDMRPTAFSQIFEQTTRVGIILLTSYYLVQKGYSVGFIASGVMAGSVFSILIAYGYLSYLFRKTEFKVQEKFKFDISDFIEWSKKILKLSLPICLGSLTLTLIYFVDSLSVPTQLMKAGNENVNDVLGFYGRGLTLIQIPVVLAQALILPLIPAISKKENDALHLIDRAIYFTHIICWPVSIAIVALTIPLNFALFGDLNESLVLSLIHLSAIFITFSILTTGILQGINLVYHPVYTLLISSVLKVILNIVLISKYGFLGLAISTLSVFFFMTCVNFWFIKKALPIQLWKRNYTVFCLGSLVMGLVIAIPSINGGFINWTRLETLFFIIIMSIIGSGIYGVILIFFRGITRKELSHLPFIGKYMPSSFKSNGS